VDGLGLVMELGELWALPDVIDVMASDCQGLSPWTGLHRVSLLEASLVMKAPGSSGRGGANERVREPTCP
jgi:hypothetical protein